MTRNTTRLADLRLGATLQGEITNLRHEGEDAFYEAHGIETTSDAILAQVLQHLLDGTPPDAVLAYAVDTLQSGREAAEHYAAQAAARARRAEAEARHRASIRALINAFPCSRCGARVDEPCLTLGTSRRPKPVTSVHAVRQRLASSATDEEVDARRPTD